MLNQDDQAFLLGIKSYIRKKPEVAAYVADFMAAGIEESRKEALHRAADMETALVLALQRRDRKYGDKAILAKLKKWEGSTSINFSTAISDLEAQYEGKEKA